MRVASGRIVSMEYSVALANGEVIERSEAGAPVQYLHGAGMLLPSLEAALEDVEEGTRRRFVLAPRDAYGERDEGNLMTVPRSLFPAGVELRVGARLSARSSGGETFPVSVRELFGDRVVMDLNHPLAGQALHFDVTVREVRSAGTEELFAGQPRDVEVV
jgi:FKBP-type peptidyl-prolyl cis-trans isomerase SlyD